MSVVNLYTKMKQLDEKLDEMLREREEEQDKPETYEEKKLRLARERRENNERVTKEYKLKRIK